MAAQAGKLALFFLPPYSPELNPDEFVWNDLKNHGTGRKLITSLSQLRQTVVSHMRQLQKLPDLVHPLRARPIATFMGGLMSKDGSSIALTVSCFVGNQPEQTISTGPQGKTAGHTDLAD